MTRDLNFIKNRYSNTTEKVIAIGMFLPVLAATQVNNGLIVIYLLGMFLSVVTLINVETVIGKITIPKLLLWISGSWLSTFVWIIKFKMLEKAYHEQDNFIPSN